METMIVTGGAGFIGANFVRFVLDQTDSQVVVVDDLTYAGNLASLRDVEDNDRYHFVKANIADRAAIDAVFDKWNPTSLVNFAAESHVDRSIDGPRAFLTTNVVGTFELLEVARNYLAGQSAAAKRFRFLHVSTDEVYGSLGDTGEFSESTPYAPNSPYSASKAAADHFVRAYHETFNLPAVITNCSNNYGPYQFPEKLIPVMILNACAGKTLPIYGDGGNIRDWLYVEDHCAGILLVLQKGRVGEKYNIGGGNERTNLQIVDTICAVLDKLLPTAQNDQLKRRLDAYTDLKEFVPDRPGHDRRYAIDAAKIRLELGWEPRWSFEQGIESTVRWYLDNREWCAEVESGGYQRERLGLLAREKTEKMNQ